MSLETDPVKAWLKVLEGVVDYHPTVSWILVPTSAYRPVTPTGEPSSDLLVRGADGYQIDRALVAACHRIYEPIVLDVHSDDWRGRFINGCFDRYETLVDTEELALGVTLVLGHNDTSVEKRKLAIFDGRPLVGLQEYDDLLREVQRRSDIASHHKAPLLEYCKCATILKTAGGLHFYPGKGHEFGDLSGHPVNHPFDRKWLMVSEMTGGYIRVTSEVKSAITLVRTGVRE